MTAGSAVERQVSTDSALRAIKDGDLLCIDMRYGEPAKHRELEETPTLIGGVTAHCDLTCMSACPDDKH